MGKVEPIRPIDPIPGQSERRDALAALIERRNEVSATFAAANSASRAAKARKRETGARLSEVRRMLSMAMKAYTGQEPETAPSQPTSALRHMGGQSWDFRTRVDDDLVPEAEMLVSLASLPPLSELLQSERDALQDDYAATDTLVAAEASEVAAARADTRAQADVEAAAKEIIKPELLRLHYEALLVQEDLIRRRAILKQLVELSSDRFRPKGDPLVDEAASYLRITHLTDSHPDAQIWAEAFSGLLENAQTELPK